MAPEIGNLVKELQKVLSDPPKDPEQRKQLYDVSRQLLPVVEDKYDTIYRIIYAPMQVTICRIASDLGLFQLLAEAKGPLSVSDMAKTTKASEVLLGRVLRYLSSQFIVSEEGDDLFAANNITQTMSIPGFQAGMRHSFDAIMPCLQKTPQLLIDSKYANPEDVLHSPFQLAHDTDLPAFVWALSQPKLLADFSLWMGILHDGAKTFLDVCDVAPLVDKADAGAAAFVDIGGGMGQQCALLVDKVPGLQGKVILQDSPPVIEQAIAPPVVERMAFDFWTEQPIKGASIYYMRNILHDCPDEKALTILKNTMAAMGPNSVILIDEMIIPNRGAHWRATQQDITMMTSLASTERTERQWLNLFAQADIKVQSTKTYNENTGESVIVLKP